jgi:hypothetical protein
MKFGFFDLGVTNRSIFVLLDASFLNMRDLTTTTLGKVHREDPPRKG